GRRGGRAGLAAVPARRRTELRAGPDGRGSDPRGAPRPGRDHRRMTGFHADTFAVALAGSVAAILLLLGLTLVCALRAGRHNVIDTTWGLAFAAVAVVAFIAARDTGVGLRRWLLLICP